MSATPGVEVDEPIHHHSSNSHLTLPPAEVAIDSNPPHVCAQDIDTGRIQFPSYVPDVCTHACTRRHNGSKAVPSRGVGLPNPMPKSNIQARYATGIDMLGLSSLTEWRGLMWRIGVDVCSV